jgi:hypothetical protein
MLDDPRREFKLPADPIGIRKIGAQPKLDQHTCSGTYKTGGGQ